MLKSALCFSLLKSCGPPNDIILFCSLGLSLLIPGITPKLLKEIAEEISVPLAVIFNLSLREGTAPHEWKHANVNHPIFKK